MDMRGDFFLIEEDIDILSENMLGDQKRKSHVKIIC